MRSEIFSEELNLIKDKALADSVRLILDEVVPEYFFRIPASSSGKYHPWYSLGYGGLVRHTKAAVKIAADLLGLEQNLSLDADAIIAALILHDTFKQGKEESGHTINDHPREAKRTIAEWVIHSLPADQQRPFSKICSLIASHMGEWNEYQRNDTDPPTTYYLPKPQTEEEKFVHMCDYLASRKYLIVEVQ